MGRWLFEWMVGGVGGQWSGLLVELMVGREDGYWRGWLVEWIVRSLSDGWWVFD